MGCNSGKTPQEHVHNYDKDNIEWQWTELSTGGYSAKAIFECGSCEESVEGHFMEIDAKVTDRKTRDATCSTPGNITYTASVTYEGENYSATKDKAIYDAEAHHFIEVEDDLYLKSAATCTEDAVYFKSCEYCHETIEETFVKQNSKLGHHMIHHEAATSTCKVHGNLEYYECDRCHKLFSDENGANEVSASDVELPFEHKMTYHPGVPATCTTDGSLDYYTCEYEPGVLYKDEDGTETFADESELFVAKFGHEMTLHEANEPTCTKEGNLKYYTCSHEEGVYYKDENGDAKYANEEEIFITKLNHELVHVDSATSSCHEHGHIEHYECSRCHKLFSDENATHELTASEVELPLTDHDMTHHDGTEATCDSDGSHDYYTCSYEDGVKYKDEDGTEKYNDDSELVINKLGHTFDDTLTCVRCDTTLKEHYGMADATAIDAIAPVTVSDMGVASGSYVAQSPVHTFLNYNFSENGGADVWVKYRYSYHDGNYDEAALQLYVLNNHDESGFRIRLDTRAENDGIVVLYPFSSGQYNNPGTDDDLPSAPSGSAQYFFPRPSGFKADTDITLHFAITLTDPVKNIFNIKIEAGTDGNLYQISKGPEAGDYNPRSFNIEMGEGFTGWTNKSIRFTAKHSNDITLSDMESPEKALVYKDGAGNLVGKLNNPGTAKAPALVANNKTFLGWFDPKGNRVNDGDAINGKVVITPRFVDTQTNMFVPSDTLGGEFAAAKGGWYETTSFPEGKTEFGGQLPVTGVSDRYDFYFIYQFVSRTNSDNYAIFGFPFDFLDAKTRIHLRIDNPTNTNLKGFVYGAATSMGDAGADGTAFTQSGFRANGSNLLIHMAVYNASGAGLTLYAEIVNLGDGQVHTETRNVTFNVADLYAINNPARNLFDLMKTNCEYRITDAF